MSKKKDPLNNLIKYNELTDEEKKRFHSAGGKARAEQYKQQKKFKELIEVGLLGELPNGMSTKEGITATLIMKAVDGDLEAFRLIRDTIGEKPIETVVSVDKDIAKASEEIEEAMNKLCEEEMIT